MAAKFVVLTLSSIWFVLSSTDISTRADTLDGCSTVNLSLTNGGYYVSGNDSFPSVIAIGEEVWACCDIGYIRRGPEAISCLSTDRFTDERPHCEDIDECTAPYYPSDDVSSSNSFSASQRDMIVLSSVLHDSFLADDQATCQGTVLLPPNEARCHVEAFCTNTDGAFTCDCLDPFIGDGINCEVDNIACVTPVAPERGSLITYSDRRVGFRCNHGYLLHGCPEQICRRGVWTANTFGSNVQCPEPMCIEMISSMECDEPSIPLHGRKLVFSRTVGSRSYFSCDDHFVLSGSSERVCQESGQWSGVPTRCKREKTLADVAVDIQRDFIDRFTSYTKSSIMRKKLGRSSHVQSLGLDLVLAFDRSSSIQSDDFLLAVNFTKQLILKFGVSYEDGGTRVAAVTFANDAQVAIDFSPESDSVEKVFTHLDDLQNSPRGGTALKEGLEVIALSIQPEMRPEAKHVLFIFTDGQHNTADPMALAADLKNKGMNIFAVGVGSFINQTALRRIASQPSSSHFFHIRSFNDLNMLSQLVSNNEIDYTPCGKAGQVTTGDNSAPAPVTGSRAAEKAWPWLTSIHRVTPNGKEMLCSGALICRQWVLTTASCFENNDYLVSNLRMYNYESDEPETLNVTIGEHNITREEGCEQTVTAGDIFKHESFEDDPSYDIALLKLTESVELNSCARTICLPGANDFLSNCYVAGWGTAGRADGQHQASQVPLQAPMPLVICRRRDTSPHSISDNILCAGDRLGQDEYCRGDHGSPLMCENEDAAWVISGLSSLGERCSQYNRHGVFTRIVPDFVDWIVSVTGNCTHEHVPAECEGC